MSKTKLIRISSRHRTSGTFSNFQVHLGQDHTRDIQNVRAVSLVSAMISNTHYNVNINNNSFVYNLTGGGETTGTLPIGQYTTATLITALQAVLTDVTITQDTLTNKLNFATTGSATLDFFSEEDRPASTLAPVIGLYTSISLGTTSNTDVDFVPDLSELDLVNIHTNISHGNCITTDTTRSQSSDIMASIPISSVWGVYNVFFENSSSSDNSKIIYDSPHSLSHIHIRLTDRDNNDITLQHDTLITLRIYYD